ncbi:hypothetical protein J2W32_002169 [Variovorax boronicumulans]|nr:hypothetical protein [Variovorax boronicumulans]
MIGFASCSLFFSRGRVSPRQATYFLLLRQKNVSKEKATLLSATLRYATGNLRCSRFAGSRRTRFAQTAASPDPRTAALLGAARRALGTSGPSLRSASSRAFASLGHRAPAPALPREGREKCKTCDTGPDALLLPLPGEGWDGGTTALATRQRLIKCRMPPPQPSPGRGGSQSGPSGSKSSLPQRKPTQAEQSEGPRAGRAQRWPVGPQSPSVCAEERSVSRIRARPCLSEASLGETPRNVSTAGCPQRSGGSQTAGSPFLCLRSFGEAKESKSPAGARPGLRPQQGKQR